MSLQPRSEIKVSGCCISHVRGSLLLRHGQQLLHSLHQGALIASVWEAWQIGKLGGQHLEKQVQVIMLHDLPVA